MFRKRASIACAAIFSVTLIGVLGGFAYRVTLSHNAIVLEPSIVDLAESPYVGDKVPIHLRFCNGSASDVVITDVRQSCSCIEVATRDGDKIECPMSIKAGETLPLRLVLLALAGGNRTQAILVRVETPSGKTIECVSTIKFRAQAGLTASPESVVVHNSKMDTIVNTSVEIMDGMENAGVVVRKVEFSDAEQLQGQLERLASADRRLQAEHEYLRTRYVLHLQITPHSMLADVDGFAVLIPEDRRFNSLRIPIHCFSPRSAYMLSPKILFVSGRPREQVRRTVSLTVESDSMSDSLAVIKKPTSVSVDVSDVKSGRCMIGLSFSLPAEPGDDSFDVVFGDGKSLGITCTLPVRLRTLPFQD